MHRSTPAQGDAAKLRLLSLFLVAALSACGGAEDDDDSQPTTTAATPTAPLAHLTDAAPRPMSMAKASPAPFEDELLALDSSRWLAADWNNGGYFINGWHPNQLSFAQGALKITLAADTLNLTQGLPAVSGEYRTHSSYGHGTFSARLMASSTRGTVVGFFHYTGPAEGTRHDEIDVEIKGDDPTQLSVNYWTDGVEHPTVIDLGFDASMGYHDYAFHWTPDSIQWFVDGRLVHEERGLRGPLPVTPGRIILNFWGATGAEPWSSTYQVSPTAASASFERVSYQPAPSSLANAVHVASLSAHAVSAGKGWRAVATIGVRDGQGLAVANATVSGSFTFGGSSSTCTTGADGACSISSDTISKAKNSTTFNVTEVRKSGATYEADADAAHSIVIAKP